MSARRTQAEATAIAGSVKRDIVHCSKNVKRNGAPQKERPVTLYKP
jgi:hypothetical protein